MMKKFNKQVLQNRLEQKGMYDPKLDHDSCGVGFIARVDGKKSHKLVRNAITILERLTHRGGCGCDNTTGDGAGIILQIPDLFFQEKAQSMGFDLPPSGRYGVGQLFLPQDKEEAKICKEIVTEVVREEGQEIIGWREVPVIPDVLGEIARDTMPQFWQVFIKRGAEIKSRSAFERKLLIIRRQITLKVSESSVEEYWTKFYFSSLSYKTITYKGLLISEQISDFYPDLCDPSFKSALALVHRRFSTNTMPTWPLAQPFRYMCHNGEINAWRGNRNWMDSREPTLESEHFGEELQKLFPVLLREGSDSANVDNLVELLALAGRPLHHVYKIMIPEAWEHNHELSDDIRSFYDYHSTMMEPWDGPALIAFTDGNVIGSLLDRNGLRPARYTITKDGLVVVGSETGVLDIPAENIEQRGRISPGKILMVDTVEQRILFNENIQNELASRHLYTKWVKDHVKDLGDLPDASSNDINVEPSSLIERQKAFGWSQDDMKFILTPMVRDGQEPLGSMGNDTPAAVMSDRPQLVFNYFKQLFAQVTNPPIDYVRERMVTSTEHLAGVKPNLLSDELTTNRYLRIKLPILTNEQLAKVRELDEPTLRPVTLPILFDPAEEKGLEKSLERLFKHASGAIAEGFTILILSDRGVGPDAAPIPSLLAVSALHHHLLREQSRTKVEIILESAEPREVHHFAMLIGYGCGSINPYQAFECIEELLEEGYLPEIGNMEKATGNYLYSIEKGLLKVISKIGISTLQSYRGAQIFEAIGLGNKLVDKYFTGTASRIGGVEIDGIEAEALAKHTNAFPPIPSKAEGSRMLEVGGSYHWRRGGERHLYNPETIALIRHALRSNSYTLYKEYADSINDQSRHLYTIRGMLEFNPQRKAIPLEEVEAAASIVKRFKTGAMSYGSISKEAHELLAVAMNRIGGRSNTGEGGEDPERYKPLPNGDSKRSSIKQCASGRFGVDVEYLTNSDEIQIKVAQGAKPGEGGQLPGHKVDKVIAKIRNSTPGVGLISPPPHHDIYSIEDLAQLIHDLKNVNPRARISVKLVSCVGVGTVAAGVSKAKADVVLISGHDGGTGASPLTSIKHTGTPWELGLSETQQTLVSNGLRSRIAVETDGQMKTGRDVAIAALLGAEEFGFATSVLVAEGCIMMRKCHLNTCPVGIATQDKELRKLFDGQPEYVINFMMYIAEELREIMASLGVRRIEDMVGMTEYLKQRECDHPKAGKLDLSMLLHKPQSIVEGETLYCTIGQDHELDKALDKKMITLCKPFFDHGKSVNIGLGIKNTNRTLGAMLSGEIEKRCPGQKIKEDTIVCRFIGSAGQSFGAWLHEGVSFNLEGDANDYVGKGLSGGKIVVFPSPVATFDPTKSVIVGNVVLYGAISGQLYARGMAGERFAIRNSGARAVVQGVGDHGCEYMTGGLVIVLGPTGRNFAAGMSGGIAYVYDEDATFHDRCNQDSVDLEPVIAHKDQLLLKGMIEKHLLYTKSERALEILGQWERSLKKFVKVFPTEYRAALEKMAQEEEASEKAEVMAK